MIAFFLAMLCASVPAQSSKVQIHERETDDHYTFYLRDNDLDRYLLVTTFAEVTETNVNRKFQGDWTRILDGGIEVSMDTREHYVAVEYRGSDPDEVARAKVIAATIRKRLGIPAPPKTI